MTCYNRRESTLACLKSVFGQKLFSDLSLFVYLVDDGSVDGTSNAVRSLYPEVRVLRGNGSLFWNGGMRFAFSEALKTGHDYYLWLNDDTTLIPDAFIKLIKTHCSLADSGYANSIVVGSTRDPVTGMLSYGGLVRKSWCYAFGFRWIEPGDQPRECVTMNGNCVLIPREVAKKVGNLDDNFTHGLGDYDYGLRARKMGCSVWVAPFYVGFCARNSIRGTWMDHELPLRQRLKKVKHPTGRVPRETMIFARRHGGLLWFLYWISLYRHLLIKPVDS